MSLNKPEPAPQTSDQPASWDLVIADLEGGIEYSSIKAAKHALALAVADMRERDAFGAAKYGLRHQAFNGRDHLVDAYQEALDLTMYLRASLAERHDGVVAALYGEAITMVVWLRAEIQRRSGR